MCAGAAGAVARPKPAPLLRAQGEQVFISYGPQGNDSLLQFYGFVEAGNPHDTYRIPNVAGRARAAAASMGPDLRSERSTVPQEDSGAQTAVRLIRLLHTCSARRSLKACEAFRACSSAWTYMLHPGRFAALKSMVCFV